jgi:hypothetical protein
MTNLYKITQQPLSNPMVTRLTYSITFVFTEARNRSLATFIQLLSQFLLLKMNSLRG